jgi:hypothetical protein
LVAADSLGPLIVSSYDTEFPEREPELRCEKKPYPLLEYDSALEVSLFVEVSALNSLRPQTRNVEAGYPEAFDAARHRIHETARKVYSRTCEGGYLLAAADF